MHSAAHVVERCLSVLYLNTSQTSTEHNRLRLHSIILASCKPARKQGRKQIESLSKASCELA